MADVFSSIHGRVALIAKGIKNKKKGQSVFLQPAQRLNIAWSSRGELGTLTEVEITEPVSSFSGERLLCVFYLNELLMRLLHKYEPHPELFEAYDEALLSIHSGEAVDAMLRVFEKKLLDELGYGLILDHDVNTGERIVANIDYYYQPVEGPSREKCDDDKAIVISGQTLIALQEDNIHEPACLKQAKQLMRLALRPHLGEKPLASRELYKAYIQQMATEK